MMRKLKGGTDYNSYFYQKKKLKDVLKSADDSDTMALIELRVAVGQVGQL